MKHWLQIIVVTILIGTAHATDKPPLRIGWTAWSDAEDGDTGIDGGQGDLISLSGLAHRCPGYRTVMMTRV